MINVIRFSLQELRSSSVNELRRRLPGKDHAVDQNLQAAVNYANIGVVTGPVRVGRTGVYALANDGNDRGRYTRIL